MEAKFYERAEKFGNSTIFLNIMSLGPTFNPLMIPSLVSTEPSRKNLTYFVCWPFLILVPLMSFICCCCWKFWMAFQPPKEPILFTASLAGTTIGSCSADSALQRWNYKVLEHQQKPLNNGAYTWHCDVRWWSYVTTLGKEIYSAIQHYKIHCERWQQLKAHQQNNAKGHKEWKIWKLWHGQVYRLI